MKLKADVQNLYATTRTELVTAAYFHVRRLLLVQPGWSCRVLDGPTGRTPDLELFQGGAFRAAVALELAVTGSEFPTDLLDSRMAMLQSALSNRGLKPPGRAYLVGVFDSDEPALYPDEAEPASQTCFWMPVNCHDFNNYVEWRPRWEKLVRERTSR